MNLKNRLLFTARSAGTQKNFAQKIQREMASLGLFAVFILSIGMAGMASTAHGQTAGDFGKDFTSITTGPVIGPFVNPGAADRMQNWEDNAVQECKDYCGNNRTCELGCTGLAETGGFAGGLLTDPLGTLEDLFGGLGGSGGPTTSFTDFDGGLLPPSEEGYSTGLTQQTNVRDFILAVTNFVLGFLGLIGVIIVIYGGFLYLSAAGNEDNAGKGKKAITYAMIGILVILGSYAIVNTVLQAPSGDDRTAEQLSGSAPSPLRTGFVSDSASSNVGNISADGSVTGIIASSLGDTSTPEGANAAQRQLFYVASGQVRTLAQALTTAYQQYAQVNASLKSVAYIPGGSQIGTSADFTLLMESKRRTLESIRSRAISIGPLQDSVPEAITAVLQELQASRSALVNADNDELKWGTDFWLGRFLELNRPSGDFQTAIAAVKTANEEEFGQMVAAVKAEMVQLESRFNDGALSNITDAFSDVKRELDGLLASGTKAKADISGSTMLQVIQTMAALNDLIKNTPFTYAVIAASTVEGSAPLLVNFDGLRSINPLNVTIPDENYKWDFGDGVLETGAVVDNIFQKPGTYVVRLTVEPTPPEQGQPQVAAGVATMRITVRLPANQIFLKAGIEGQENPFWLRQYDEQTNELILDQNVLRVSSTEARAGVTFDASDTDRTKLRSIRWNFGDNSPEVVQSGTGLELSQNHVYAEPGAYQMFLEVTDIQGNIDRKIVNVVVGSPVARITPTNGTVGKVGDVFVLDGSTSGSDNGTITNYEWTHNSPDEVTLQAPNNTLTGERLGIAFPLSGVYRVTLTVTDSLGNRESQTVELEVQSEPPVAQFTYSFPDASQPGTVHLDASSSYDPDNEAGELHYEWFPPGNAGTDYEVIDAGEAGSQKTAIKFLNPGTYTIGLQVRKKENISSTSQIFEKQIVVDNTLDIAWGEAPVTATLAADPASEQLAGQIDFKLVSTNAVAYELDFGDGEIESGEMSGQVTVPHQYGQSGRFTAKATVFDARDNENSVSRKVFVGSGDTPIAVAGIQVNGVELFNTIDPIEVTRQDTITFDAGGSLNTDGTGRRLSYSWDLGDGTRSSQQKLNHKYRDTGEYTAKLSVRSSETPGGQSVTDEVTINVVGELPMLRGLTVTPTSGSLTTPVTVSLNALGAQDRDGRITRYRWWYYESNPDDALGVQVTSGPSATINIGTRGPETEGQEKSYKFCVTITDDENNSVNSCDEEVLGEARSPELTVTNGPNKPPVASFTVDRTSVMAGDVVNFVSTSRDPDGRIEEYCWDFTGLGFKEAVCGISANVPYTFTQVNREGIRVRLKVRDDNESEAISQPITIYVDGFAKPPVASFTANQEGSGRRVSFRSTSTADAAGGANIVRWEWDFNTTFDSDGDGNSGNDVDSTNENPSYQYPDYGIFRASLTVTDDQQNKTSKTQFVRVVAPDDGDANLLAAGTMNAASVLVSGAGFAIILIRLKKRNNINK